MSQPAFPADFELDLHDLAAIILDCHARLEDRFSKVQLTEVLADSANLQTLPPHVLPPEWLDAKGYSPNQKRLTYIFRQDSSRTEPVTIDNFAHPDGVKLSPGLDLNRRTLENAFWRCKTFNTGWLLAYVAQTVVRSLPRTARIRARTASGYEMTCSPLEVMAMEMEVLPHQACCMVVYEPRPDLGPTKVDMAHHFSGFLQPMPWIYLCLGEDTCTDPEHSTRVALDLAIQQIGGRGGAHELFALERISEYHERILPRFAQEYGELILSDTVALSPLDIRKQGDDIVRSVLERLTKIANGDHNFCRYCGKDGVETRCSTCKEARFCKECHVSGWKYHKVWCKPAGA